MSDVDAPAGGFDYYRAFPWLHLFRAFRVAIDPRKLILGAAALVLIAFAEAAIGEFPFVDRPARVQWPWEAASASRLSLGEVITNLDGGRWAERTSTWDRVAVPWWQVVEPGLALVRPHASWSSLAENWSIFLVRLLVWSLAGTALCRMAALQFARDRRLPMGKAVDYSRSRFLSSVGAPILGALGIGLFAAICLLAGAIGSIPVVGEWLVGLVWFVPLGLGLVITLILIAVAAGWPLMNAAIAVDGSDGFDGFSRAFSYVYGRPWHYLWNWLVALFYGGIVLAVVDLVGVQTLAVTEWSVNGWIGNDGLARNEAVQFWTGVFRLLLAGVAISYFWSAATIVYFLMRRTDDAIPLDVVWEAVSDEDADADGSSEVPVAGVAAAGEPVIERPAPADDGGEPDDA